MELLEPQHRPELGFQMILLENRPGLPEPVVPHFVVPPVIFPQPRSFLAQCMGEHLPEPPALTLRHVAALLVTGIERHAVGILSDYMGTRNPDIVDGHILSQLEALC